MLVKGNSFSDQRGILCFVNDFDFKGIKRFYTITHPDINVFRAWQGHKIESKCFFVTKGEFIIYWLEIDNWERPGKDIKVVKQILTAEEPQILIVPSGHANGFKAMKSDSTLVIFSNLTLEESSKDLYRFYKDYWKVDE